MPLPGANVSGLQLGSSVQQGGGFGTIKDVEGMMQIAQMLGWKSPAMKEAEARQASTAQGFADIFSPAVSGVEQQGIVNIGTPGMQNFETLDDWRRASNSFDQASKEVEKRQMLNKQMANLMTGVPSSSFAELGKVIMESRKPPATPEVKGINPSEDVYVNGILVRKGDAPLEKPIVVGEGAVLATPEGVPLFENPKQMSEADKKIGLQTANALRDEWNALSKNHFTVKSAFERINAVTKKPSAAGDLSLIFDYMKLLDPASTVREGEFATAQNSAGIPERVRAQWNRILNGERMAPEQRADFVDKAKTIYDSSLKNNNEVRARYTNLAKTLQVNPDAIFGDIQKPSSGKVDGDLSKMSDDEIKKQLKEMGM